MKEEYLKEAREILEDIHYQWSEPKPGTFKGMVQSLAERLKKRDARQPNEWEANFYIQSDGIERLDLNNTITGEVRVITDDRDSVAILKRLLK